MRIKTADVESDIPSTNTVQIRRLMVKSTAARILEALLGFVLLLVFIVSVLVPTKNVLLKPPFSIGAQASPLADSQLVHQMREWEGSTTSLRTAEWGGLRVKLGWWDRPEFLGGKRYGLDVVDDDVNVHT